MEKEKDLNISTLMKILYKPEYSNLFNKIKGIKTSVKNEILMYLLDGRWHAESEIIRNTRKKHNYVGSLTLRTMVDGLNSLNNNSNYLEKKNINGRIFYKLSKNYVGLTRFAYTSCLYK